MCKRLLNWFRCCKKKSDIKPAETKVAEPIVETKPAEPKAAETKVMNAEAFKKYSSAWLHGPGDCYMRDKHVAKMLGVSMSELNARISPNMQREWINDQGMFTETYWPGLDLGLTMKDIEVLASCLNIQDNKSITELRSKYEFALRNAGWRM